MTILPVTRGSLWGLPNSGPCSWGKIPCRDEDGDEKPPAANSGTGTMLPAPQGSRILTRELVEAFAAPFSSSSRTDGDEKPPAANSGTGTMLPAPQGSRILTFDIEDVSLHLDESMKT
ncbi:hypothetical protein JHK86_039819 [Glycine max]|nr:hypothetical protein JHK86_039819 [Glycine max]